MQPGLVVMGTLPSSNSTLTYDGMGEFFSFSSTVPSVDPVVSGHTEQESVIIAEERSCGRAVTRVIDTSH